MPRIPEFSTTLQKMNKVHISKNQDYANDANPFFNFDSVEMMIAMFKNNRDKTYAHFVANKLARLANLLNSGKDANNESLQDTLVDMANYCVLWKCDISRRKEL
jgi:hypothetical protein